MTYTVAEMSLSCDVYDVYDEIKVKLKEAGYDHCFLEDGLIELSGIGITREPEPELK